MSGVSPCCGEGSCCTPKVAWGVTAITGVVIAALGAVAIASLYCQGLDPVRNLMQQAANGMGTAPIVLPVVIASVGGAITLAAILGYACREKDAIG